MTMTPRVSKFMLTSHITFSVGWLGAIAVFLVLAITGLTSNNTQLVRSAYFAMELSAWYVILPFCLASLVTGIIQGLGTKWGLFKYYWIFVKLFLTIAMTVLLFLHMQPISYLAGTAADATEQNIRQSHTLIDLISKAGAAILALIAIITLSVYKPWGKTTFKFYVDAKSGAKREKKGIPQTKRNRYILIGIICLLIIFIILHLVGVGLGHH